jgi:hypothetical protein
VGDYLCQKYFEKKEILDKKRIGVMSAVGFTSGPILHFWFQFISEIPFMITFSKSKQALLMTLID